MPRLTLPTLAALALVLVSQASPASNAGAISQSPMGLRAFLLRSDEPVTHSYSRTPSFTWAPVGLSGGHYQFQIATSQSFQDGTLVFKDTHVAQPRRRSRDNFPGLRVSRMRSGPTSAGSPTTA
jgi:hypothetical protein